MNLGLLLHVTIKTEYLKYPQNQLGKEEEWLIHSGVSWSGGGDPLVVLHTKGCSLRYCFSLLQLAVFANFWLPNNSLNILDGISSVGYGKSTALSPTVSVQTDL